MRIVKVALLLIPLLMFGLFLIHILARSAETMFVGEAAQIARLTLCGVSAVLSVFVLAVHWIFPPHPKFMLLARRYVCIKLHVIAGTVEFLAGICAFWFDPICAKIMAGAAVVHIATAIYQTPIVFGSRAMMIPSYLLCIALHGYCALHLWWHPDSEFWLIQTFLTFSIYAWVRLFYFAFKRFRIFEGWAYTVSVLAAGVTIAPAVLGPAAILLVIVFVALYIVLYWLIWVSKRSELLEYLTEHRRETYISGKLRRRLDRVKASASIPNRDEHLSDRDASNAVFKKLDTDNNGNVTKNELKTFLLEERVPRWLVDGLVGLLTQTQFTPEEFHERIWSFGVARRIGSGEMQQATTPRERAKAVFDQLDLNRNGIINSFEFGLLLMEWDLPPRDVERCIQKYAGDAGEISFGQFSEKLKPVWKFAYQDVIARKLHT